MANTYEAIATVEVGSGGASYMDFTNIPQTFSDIKMVVSGRFTSNNVWLGIELNSSTANFTAKHLQGNGSSASSTSFTAADTVLLIDRSTDTASTFSNGEFYIPNYAGSNYKSISVDTINENNATTAYQGLTAYLWSNTAAITSIRCYGQNSAVFAEYTTATLYGIKNS